MLPRAENAGQRFTKNAGQRFTKNAGQEFAPLLALGTPESTGVESPGTDFSPDISPVALMNQNRTNAIVSFPGKDAAWPMAGKRPPDAPMGHAIR